MPAAEIRKEVRGLRTTIAEHSRLLARAVSDLEVQFKRIAQIQAELDDLRKASRRGES